MPHEEEDSAGRRSLQQARATLRMVGGTAGGQAVALALVPILARIYGPETFGAMAVVMAITLVLGVVVCGGFQVAIPIPKRRHRAAQLFWLSIGTCVLVSALIAVFFGLGGHHIGALALDGSEASLMVWFVPVGAFCIGVAATCSRWLARRNAYNPIAASQICNQAGGGLTALVFGLRAPMLASLAWGRLIGLMVSAGMLGGAVLAGRERPPLGRAGLRGVLREARRSRKFVLIDVWASLMNAVSVFGIPVVLAFFFTDSLVGNFAVANRIVSLPVAVVSGAAGIVFQQAVSRAWEHGRAATVVRETAAALATVAVTPFLILAVASDPLFTLLLGPGWELAGKLAAILALWQVSVFVGSPLTPMFAVVGRQGALFLWNLVLLAVRVAALAIGGLLDSIHLALGLYAVAGVAVWALMVWSVMRIAHVSVRHLAGVVRREIAWAIPLTGMAILAKLLAPGQPVLQLVGIGLVAAVGVCLRWRYDAALRKSVTEILLRRTPTTA